MFIIRFSFQEKTCYIYFLRLGNFGKVSRKIFEIERQKESNFNKIIQIRPYGFNGSNLITTNAESRNCYGFFVYKDVL